MEGCCWIDSRWRPRMFTGFRRIREGWIRDFFYFVLKTKIYPGDGFVFIFNSGEWSSSARSTDRLRKAPSVSVVSLEVAAMWCSIVGSTAEASSLKPDIMQGTRGAGWIKGEQSTGLENVLHTGRSVDVCVVRHRMKPNKTTAVNIAKCWFCNTTANSRHFF